MAKQITLTIDNIRITVPENTLVINAAKKAGIAIPAFCYHPKLQSVGMCRVCLVEVGRPVIDRTTGQTVFEPDGEIKIQYGPKLETACTTPVSDGMVVKTDSEKARAARKEILEFILTSHPLDCPVCDKGGECPLQSLTMRYGPDSSRFRFDEKKHLAKKVPLGELIILDRERCIQCGRCIRFQSDIANDPVIGFYQRGRSTQIITTSEPGFDSVFSGNTTDICPVGALTTADFRFGARPWEMHSYASVCTHCPVGCNISIDVRREAKSGGGFEIKRIMPRQNEAVNSLWICDKGRFAHHFTDPKQRILKPLARKGGNLLPVGINTALDLVASVLRGRKKRLATLLGGRLSNEDLFNYKILTEELGGKAYLYADQDGGESSCHAGLGPGTDLTNIKPGTVVLVVASDVYEEAPLYWLWIQQAVKRGAKLVTINPRKTRLDQFAFEAIQYRYGDELHVIEDLLVDLKKDGSPIVRLIKKAEGLIVFAGRDGLDAKTSKEVYQGIARLVSDSGYLGKTGSGMVVIGQSANTQGAWEMGLKTVGSLEELIRGTDVLMVAGADILGDHPELESTIKSLKTLIVLELATTPTSEQADVVIPVQAFTERMGSYTSAARRVQVWQPALPAPNGLRPDFVIAAMLGQRLGIELADDASDVFSEITRVFPVFKGLDYDQLSRIEEQWPITGGSDKYFSGTVAMNRLGLGKQLPLASPNNTTWKKASTIKKGAYGKDKLWAVPVSRLYDLGNTLRPTKILEKRLAAFVVYIHPETASELEITPGAVSLTIKGKDELVRCIVDADVPLGFALIPRSSGVPLLGVEAIHLSAIAEPNHTKGNRQK